MTSALVCGAGGFGLTWTTALSRAGVDVVGVIDPSATAIQEFRAQLTANVPAFDSLSEATEETSADFVLDSSPFSHRETNASLAFEAGMDLLGAKPLGGSLEQSERIIGLAGSMGRRVGVALQMRFFPCFLALKHVLRTAQFGRMRRAKIRMSLDGRGWIPGMEWRLKLANPLLLEAGIHHFDLMNWVFGDQPAVHGALASNPPWSPFAQNANFDAVLSVAGSPVLYSGHFAPHPDTDSIRFDSGWRVECDDVVLRVESGGLFADGELIGGEVTQDPLGLDILNVEVLQRWLDQPLRADDGLVTGEEYLKAMRPLSEALREGARGV